MGMDELVENLEKGKFYTGNMVLEEIGLTSSPYIREVRREVAQSMGLPLHMGLTEEAALNMADAAYGIEKSQHIPKSKLFGRLSKTVLAAGAALSVVGAGIAGVLGEDTDYNAIQEDPQDDVRYEELFTSEDVPDYYLQWAAYETADAPDFDIIDTLKTEDLGDRVKLTLDIKGDFNFDEFLHDAPPEPSPGSIFDSGN